MHTFFTVHF